MQRGYIKFWRKAQDSSSWNRGLMYQGLIINLLSRAAWKKGSYQGRDILPGQFGTVLNHLAESLDVPRSTLQRMVAHLETDGFIKTENVGHRFTIITIVNWHSYQESEKDAWAADGPPVGRSWAADGPPVGHRNSDPCDLSNNQGGCEVDLSYIGEEEKKEEDKNINTPPTPKGGNVRKALSASQTPKSKTRAPTGNSLPELRQAVADYTASEPLRKTLEDFRLMRERIRKPMTGRALKLLFIELDKLARSDGEKIAILEQSILNSWQGVFEIRGQARASPPVPDTPTPASVAAFKTREEQEAWIKACRKRDGIRQKNEVQT